MYNRQLKPQLYHTSGGYMRLLSKTPAILHRHTGNGYYTEDGDWEEGGVKTSNIRCSFQPAFRSGIYQKTLPDGIHQKDCRSVYTRTELITGSEKEVINSDYLTVNGHEYEVYEVQEWFAANKLTHYQALVIRRDKLNASR